MLANRFHELLARKMYTSCYLYWSGSVLKWLFFLAKCCFSTWFSVPLLELGCMNHVTRYRFWALCVTILRSLGLWTLLNCISTKKNTIKPCTIVAWLKCRPPVCQVSKIPPSMDQWPKCLKAQLKKCRPMAVHFLMSKDFFLHSNVPVGYLFAA